MGRIIPYSFSKIRQDEESPQLSDIGFSFCTSQDTEQISDNTQTESLDSFSTSLQSLDLLDTVLADFARGKLRPCDIDGPFEDSSYDLSNENPRAEERICDESPENLSETCQTLLSPGDRSQSTLSESFCDEIFDELEKTATFHKFTDWSSNNENKFEKLHQDFQQTKERERDSR